MRTSSAGPWAWISSSGFGLGDDADDAAVFGLQAVAVAQADGLREVEQEFVAGFGGEHDAAAVAAVESIRTRRSRPASPGG